MKNGGVQREREREREWGLEFVVGVCTSTHRCAPCQPTQTQEEEWKQRSHHGCRVGCRDGHRLYVFTPPRARLGHRHRTHIEVLLLLLLSQTEHVNVVRRRRRRRSRSRSRKGKKLRVGGGWRHRCGEITAYLRRVRRIRCTQALPVMEMNPRPARDDQAWIGSAGMLRVHIIRAH